MSHDISQPVPQGSIGAQDAENSRVGAIADELYRLCELYEAQRGDSQPHVSPFLPIICFYRLRWAHHHAHPKARLCLR